jgi:alpha-tubulin suppressor-like RCC1 family protein
MSIALRRRRTSRVAAVVAVGVGIAVLAPAAPGLAETNEVFTWGSNGFGQLGDGSPTSTVRGTPSAMPLTGVVDLSGGREHVIALTDQGSVVTWGSDVQGALGNGLPLANSTTPVTVPGLSGVTDVDDGHYHSLALKGDGTVWGWGYNALGQLGTGDATTRYASPVRWGSVSNAVGVFGGRDMTYVLAADGDLWCSGGYGRECGLAVQGAKVTTPVTVGGLPALDDVAGGRNHAVALADDGTVWTWGDNAYGQLGDGTRTSRGAPRQVAGLSGIVDVGAGAEHSMAVTASGQVYVWGRGYRGELGLGTTSDRLSPVVVPALPDIVDVDAGRSHSFAIGADGRLWAWGWNAGRQVSTSSATSVLSPVVVPGLSGVTLASGGQSYSVAVAGDTSPPPPPDDPILTDGFDSGLSAWTVTGPLTLDSTAGAPSGTPPSVRASGSAAAAAAWRSLPAAEDAVCMEAWVRRESVSTTTTLLRLRTTTGSGIAALRVTSTGELRARSEISTANASAGATLAAGTWRQVALCVDHVAGGGGRVFVEVAGVQTGSWAWPTAPTGQVQVGSLSSFTATFNVDDVVVVR